MDRRQFAGILMVIFLGFGIGSAEPSSANFFHCSSQVSALTSSYDNDTASTETMEDVNATTPRPRTVDDFIHLSYVELSALRKVTKIKIIGYFQGKYLMIEDSNSTLYLVGLPRREEAEEEIKEKLKNHTGEGEICVGHLCLSYEDSVKRMKELEAMRLGKLIPSEVTNFAVMTSIVCLVILTGVTGNLLIIVGVLRSSKLRNSTSVLICCLAASDILVLVICLPLQVVTRFFPTAYMSLEVCRLLYYVKHFSIVSSTLTMSAMAIDRYIAVCHPLKAKSYCTVKNARYGVIIIWVLSLGICLPVIWLVIIRDGVNAKYCLLFHWTIPIKIAYYIIILFVVLGVSLTTMVPAYLKIFCVLWKSTSEAKALQNANGKETGEATNNKQENENIRTRIQVIRMLVVVLVIFTLCWGPPTILDAFTSLEYTLFRITQRVIHPDVTFVLTTIAYCNSFFNPLIYLCMSRQFRDYLLSMCKGRKGHLAATSSSSASSKYQTGSEVLSETKAPPSDENGENRA